MKLNVSDFCARQFTGKSGGTNLKHINIEDFENYVNDNFAEGFEEYIEEMKITGEDFIDTLPMFYRVEKGMESHLMYLTIPNFTKAKVGTMEITIDNYQYLRSGYSARQEGEVPVLSRWFELPLSPPKAKYLVLVLYSREHLEQEHNDFPKTAGTPFEMDGDWGVVAILGQKNKRVDPMTPVTAMRNALGKAEGGSGVPLDKEYYNRCVGFWSNHAIVKTR